MTVHPYSWECLLDGLGGTPRILRRLLPESAPADPVWDFTPTPYRLTLRGITAHLAAWDVQFQERILRARDEDRPLIHTPSEEQIDAAWNFAESDPHVNIDKFTDTRRALVDTLTALADADIDRVMRRDPYPEMSIGMTAVMILGHDGYHLAQISEWLEAYENGRRLD